MEIVFKICGIQWSYTHVLGVPEGTEKEIGLKDLFNKIRAENFPNLEGERYILKKGAHRIYNRHDQKRT